MTTQYGEQGENRQSYRSDNPNFGSARSDYGKHAYGGALDAQGMESGSRRDDNRGRDRGSRGSQKLRGLKESKGLGQGLLLLGGAGVGAALLYMFMPGQKRRPHTFKQGDLTAQKCRDLMTEDPTCCLPSDPVSKAAQLMKSENVGSVPVVQDHQTKKLIGIVTDRDLALQIVAEARDARSTKVEDVMTSGVTACRADDDLQKALDEMAEQQVRRIPVVDDSNRIVGIIAQADVATRIEAPKKTAEVVEEISKSSAAGR